MNDARRADLRVDEPTGPRWSLGVEAISNGHIVLLADRLLLYLSADRETMSCEILTLRDLPARGSHAAQALETQVRDAGILIDSLTSDDPKFSALVASHAIQFDIVNDDGNSAVNLARNIDPAAWAVPD